jgi:hypothetical protein
LDDNAFKEVVLKVAGFEGNIYEQDEEVSLDNGIRITSYIETHLIAMKTPYVSHFGFLTSRVEGVGNLNIFLYGINRKIIRNPPAWELDMVGSVYRQKPINFVDAKMSVKLMCNENAGDKFSIFDLFVDAKALWAETPRIPSV